MAKKLRKKIEELCGIAGLAYGARRARAEDILASKDWKHELCNDLIGLSFRDLEKHLNGVIAEREVKQDVEDTNDVKLNTYKAGRASKKGLPARSDGPNQTPKPQRAPPRSIEQIMAQARGPRVERLDFSEEERKTLLKFRGVSGTANVLSDAMHADSETE